MSSFQITNPNQSTRTYKTGAEDTLSGSILRISG